MDFFDAGLSLSLAVCLAGAAWRAAGWFRKNVPGSGPAAELHPPYRAQSRRLLGLLRALILDILLLGRTASPSRPGLARRLPRWVAHALVFFGFMGLLMFHAMGYTVAEALFPGYEPTLDPWQFLRNLLGLLVLAGLLVFLARRFADRRLRGLARFQDWALPGLLVLIMLSGFGLEAAKIMSPTVFDRMVEEFYPLDDPQELRDLTLFWTTRYGLVPAKDPGPADAAALARGEELNEDGCASCHSDTASAFVSRPLASFLAPLSRAFTALGADRALWYLHVGLCFLGLMVLPFGKFFHPLSTPLNLIARGGERTSSPHSRPALMLGIDACTRCGECALRCSVRPAFEVLGNPDILPMEKLADLNRLASGRLDSGDLDWGNLAEGSRICTECLRCTDICPSGIDLQELWMRSARAFEGPNEIVRRTPPAELPALLGQAGPLDPMVTGLRQGRGLADMSSSFLACVQCTTCTSVCPVVAVSRDSTADLDLTPQQIMNLLRMGLKDRALGARMVWSCTTCYKCQEHCPQSIPVADILFELRNIASARLRGRAPDQVKKEARA